jgi:uncharacterized repeat protein (TIGR01451 family)
VDQFYQTPQPLQTPAPNRRKFYGIAVAALIIAIVAMLAYYYKDAIISLFSRAGDQAQLTWGGEHQVHPFYPCLAPVETTPNQAGGFVFDTENRLNLFNKGTAPSGEVNVQVNLNIQGEPAQFSANEVTVSTGTYANGVWTIPSIAVGEAARINIKRNNMPAVPFNVSLSGGESISTECGNSSYFEFVDPASAPVSAKTPEPASTPTAIAEAPVDGTKVDPSTIITPDPVDGGGDVDGGGGDIPAPPPECADTEQEISTIGASYRVFKNTAVVKILTDKCGKFTFAINSLGPNQEILPYDAQNVESSKVFELGFGTHYLTLPVNFSTRPLSCGFQSDLYIPIPGSNPPRNKIFAYDWAERGCVVIPPPTTTALTCAPASQTVAVGGTASFTATGGTAPYTWSTTGDNPTKPLTGPTAQFTYGSASNSPYTVTVTDTSVPPKTATCTVIVSATPPPPPPPPGVATLTCNLDTKNPQVGQPVNFSSTYTPAPGSSAGLSYRWSAPGGNPSNGFADRFTTTYAASDPNGQTVTVTVGGLSADCKFKLADAPTQQTLACSPATSTVAANTEVTFTASNGSGSYGWQVVNDAAAVPQTGTGITFKSKLVTPTRGIAATQVKVTSPYPAVPGSQEAFCYVTVNELAGPDPFNLAISKTVTNATPRVGDRIIYGITLENKSSVINGTGISVKEILPAGVTFLSLPIAPSQGSFNQTDGVWTVGALNAGRNATMQIEVTVNAVGTHKNTVEITASTPTDTILSDNSAETTINVSAGSLNYDIEVQKDVSNSTVNVGDAVQYTVYARNLGTGTATGVVLRDVLPSTMTYVSHSTQTGTYSQSTGLWTIGTMASGARVMLDITARPNTTGTIVNTASLDDIDQTDGNSSNNEDTATITVGSGGGGGGGGGSGTDIAITKIVNDETPTVGQQVTYTITAFNNGPRDASDVTVRDVLPAGVTYVSNSTADGSYNSNTGIWTIGDLDEGDTARLYITATATQTGTIVNTAKLDDSDPNDTRSINDEDSATITVGSGGGGGSGTDIAVTKFVSNDRPGVGAHITYTINVTNLGPDNATGLTIEDKLPSQVAFVKVQTSKGTYDKNSGIWTIGSLASGSGAVMQITVSVLKADNFVNLARLNTVDQSDSNSSNNQSQVTVTSRAVPGLPAAGFNTAAPVVIGFLFMLLAFIVNFLGSTKRQTVLAESNRKIDTTTRFD